MKARLRQGEAFDELVDAKLGVVEAFRDASSARVSGHFAREGVFGADDRLEIAGVYRRSRMDFIQHFLIGKPLEHNAQTSYMLTGAWILPRGNLTTRIVIQLPALGERLAKRRNRGRRLYLRIVRRSGVTGRTTI